jgi:putative GTP pyrophosphokinase
MLENKTEFLAKYQIDDKDYRKSKLKWDELKAIYNDFTQKVHHLNSIGLSISNALQVQTGVHSVRFRVKDPEHLIEKIIRKVAENPKRKIDLTNYEQEITDLVGVRAIHLFKSNWESIDQFIRQTWEFKEDPIAYFRKGDPEDIRSTFNSSKFDVKEHKAGYRSLHYVIITKPTKIQHFVEVQVRTLFEEGWSEIDHKIRYPYDTNNDLINSLLMIFNRLAGSADEIGEYVKTLSFTLKAKEEEYLMALGTREREIESLKTQIDGLKLNQQQKTKLFDSIDQISKSQNSFGISSTGGDLSKLLSKSVMLGGKSSLDSTVGSMTKLSELAKLLAKSNDRSHKLGDYAIGGSSDLINNLIKIKQKKND